MKKLLVMVIALAVVFGMSAGVMANELTSDSFDVTFDVEEMAVLLETDDFNFEGMKITDFNDSDESQSDRFTFKVAANTGVNLLVRQEYTNWETIFGTELNGNQVFWDQEAGPNDRWIISPNVIVDGNSIDGAIDKDVTVMSYENNGLSDDIEIWMETNMNPEYEWYEWDADETLKGSLTITVEAN